MCVCKCTLSAQRRAITTQLSYALPSCSSIIHLHAAHFNLQSVCVLMRRRQVCVAAGARRLTCTVLRTHGLVCVYAYSGISSMVVGVEINMHMGVLSYLIRLKSVVVYQDAT